MPKPTILEKYRDRKYQLMQKIGQERVTADAVWQCGELAYRVSVLETCQTYAKSAPVTTKTEPLTKHYQMLDAYIQNLATERAYGPMRGPDTEKERNAARMNLSRVIGDYRNRLSSFAPSRDTAYSEEVGRVINAFMPAWLQMRETFVPLREKKEDKQG